MSELNVLNFKQWIQENRHRLKPPVGNEQIWKERNPEFIIMVVGGPNSRKDYHINEGEEFFYQLEGTMVLKIIEDGKPRDVTIKAGDIFLLPPHVPHSPQRGPNTIGLVVERKRRPGEKDGARWYCEQCHEVLHHTDFELKDITTQLKVIFEQFYADESLKKCKKCGTVMQPPAPVPVG